MLKTESLTHVYSSGTPFEHVAIYDIDFEVEKGEYLGIIGATGSGKSTFISHLNGLIKPTSGRVLYEGKDIHESKSFTRDTRFKVGLVFQYPEYQLFESTVFEDIAFGPKNMGLSASDVEERVLEAAGFAGLGDQLLKKSPFELSGGEKRRAAIAGVIAMRPEVLILDEPTAGLDPRGREEILRNVMNYKNAHGATVIMVTHDMEQLARAVDRIVILAHGKLEMQGTPAQIFSQDEALSALGLSAPKVTLVAARLRALGLKLPEDIYTTNMLCNALKELKQSKGKGESVRSNPGGDDHA
ncbi:MAG: energy-coupling factor transporter ATPase [Oscillospiraceae bacterium]|nr:energy-coupling factor transporter ATPase [Oscillospiraceae bacterium]